MLCGSASSRWGKGAVGVYGDHANSGLCSDGAEYTACTVFAFMAVVLLCLPGYRLYVLPWLLFAFSFLNLAFGQIVVRDGNFDAVSLMFNSRQLTMPLIIFALCSTFTCITSFSSWCAGMGIRAITFLYTATVSYAAWRYDLKHDNPIFTGVDAAGIGLSFLYAVSIASVASVDSGKF
tara:strand:+ start:1359 stop:1892 length:534 start_codon:yes stop_codon:yes gene_type:complete